MFKQLIQDLRLIKQIYTAVKNSPSSDILTRFESLHQLGHRLVPEYRFKWPQMQWWQEEAFNEYLQKFDELNGMNVDRHWMLYQLMRLVENIPGDTAECGIYQGCSSYMMCKMNQNNSNYHRIHFMFDSFEGLSAPSEIDGTHWQKGNLSCDMNRVEANLSGCSNYSLHKGWIPERFLDVENRLFSFVHIDVDLYNPTFDSIQFFYPRIHPGGIIVCDDYGFTSCVGATKAVDEFLQDKPEKMIQLSCGGGFLIKGYVTTKPLEIR